MIRLPDMAGRRFVVLGLGRTGLSAGHALIESGAEALLWDDSEAARATAVAEGLPIADPKDMDWNGVDALVLSPGIPHSFPEPHPVAAAAQAAGRPVICDIELFARAHLPATLVGITGTNGKSTTTALIGHLLERTGRPAAVGGNLGTGVLALPMMDAAGTYVLELSSYQLERVPSLAPDIAVLLNISPDHLDRHGGLEGYVAAKRRLLESLSHDGRAVIGVDDEICREIAGEFGARAVPVSVAEPVDGGAFVTEDGRLVDTIDGPALEVADLGAARALPGEHNWQNAAAAYSVARLLGLPRSDIVNGLMDFGGLAHRQERVGEIDGVVFINDSKATNADAAARALTCYENIHWIAGGRAKAGGIDGLAPYFSRIAAAYLIGEAEESFARTLEGRVAVSRCGTLDRAVNEAFEAARAGRSDDRTGLVLLSPAAASFDQFRSFEARGEAFRAHFRALSTKNAAAGNAATQGASGETGRAAL